MYKYAVLNGEKTETGGASKDTFFSPKKPSVSLPNTLKIQSLSVRNIFIVQVTTVRILAFVKNRSRSKGHGCTSSHTASSTTVDATSKNRDR